MEMMELEASDSESVERLKGYKDSAKAVQER